MLGALQTAHIRRLWASQVFSAMGDQLYLIAVVWLAVEAVGSRGGLVVAAGSASAVVFGLIGGVYADRWDRRKTMVASDVLRALAIVTVPIAAHLEWVSVWHLGVVAILVAGLDSLFDPALQASLPALAGDTRTLRAANGLMDATRRLARTVSPALAGLLAAALPVAHFFTLDALSFVVSGAVIFSLGSRFRWKPSLRREPPKGLGGLLVEVRAAFGSVGESRVLMWGFAVTGLASAVFSAVIVVGAALAAVAVAAVGGPMGDLMLLTMIQTDQPSERIGKVYGLLATTSHTASALVLALAGPLFALVGPRAGMACFSLAVVVVGTVGLFYFRDARTGMYASRVHAETHYGG